MADVDASFVQQVLDIAERQGKPDVHHNRQADDFRAGPKILEWGVFRHPKTLRDHPAPLNRIPSDKAATPYTHLKAGSCSKVYFSAVALAATAMFWL